MSHRPSILVIDDDESVVSWLIDSLHDEGCDAIGESDPRLALTLLKTRAFDVVVSDVEMPGLRGIDLVKEIKSLRPKQVVILITAFGSIDLAVEAVRAGAVDFIAKPFRIENLMLSIQRALRERELDREIVRLREAAASHDDGGLVARSASMKRLLELTRRAARSELPILFTGESGVGKGAFAQLVHRSSERSAGPFVAVNCATLPATLAEAELFGVRKGAFTDAKQDRPGVFEQANGGTLFLDELGELPLELQAKLLQALEARHVRPLGSTAPVKVDVRLLAATNRPLEEALRERTFRADLYHRLNVVRIEIPPLRERREDISPLVDQTLERLSSGSARGPLALTTAARQWLHHQPWSGNVRELLNAVERAVALSDSDVLDVDDFVSLGAARLDVASVVEIAAAESLSLADLERRYIAKVLEQTGGNKGKAAKILGLDRRTLYRKVAEIQNTGGHDADEPSEDG